MSNLKTQKQFDDGSIGWYTKNYPTNKTNEVKCFTPEQIKDFAVKCSEMATIRIYDYDNCCYIDDFRAPITIEKSIVRCAVESALWAISIDFQKRINNKEIIAGILTIAEYVVHTMQDSQGMRKGEERINSYDSVYLPLKSFLKDYIGGE